MARKTYDDGWQACLKAIENTMDRGKKDGRECAHMSAAARRTVRDYSYHDYASSSLLYIPSRIVTLAYEAGFDKGVEQAEDEARRIGEILTRCQAEEPAIDTAVAPEAEEATSD